MVPESLLFYTTVGLLIAVAMFTVWLMWAVNKQIKMMNRRRRNWKKEMKEWKKDWKD